MKFQNHNSLVIINQWLDKNNITGLRARRVFSDTVLKVFNENNFACFNHIEHRDDKLRAMLKNIRPSMGG